MQGRSLKLRQWALCEDSELTESRWLVRSRLLALFDQNIVSFRFILLTTQDWLCCSTCLDVSTPVSSCSFSLFAFAVFRSHFTALDFHILTQWYRCCLTCLNILVSIFFFSFSSFASAVFWPHSTALDVDMSTQNYRC